MMPCFRMGMGVIQMLQKKGGKVQVKKTLPGRVLEVFCGSTCKILQDDPEMLLPGQRTISCPIFRNSSLEMFAGFDITVIYYLLLIITLHMIHDIE